VPVGVRVHQPVRQVAQAPQPGGTPLE